MTDMRETGDVARTVFAGLTPSNAARHLIEKQRERSRLARGFMATMPFVVAGAMTVTFNLTGPIEAASAAAKKPPKPGSDTSALRLARGVSQAPAAPRIAASEPAGAVTYTVGAGDTVVSIAGRFGISTASVLALNGLSWKSLVFPGQVLRVDAATAPAPQTAPSGRGGRYTIQRDDTIARIAERFGVPSATLLSVNGLGAGSIIHPGQTIAIPRIATASTASSESLERPAVEPVSAGVAVKLDPVVNTPAALQDGSSVTPLTEAMAANARIIIAVGHQLGVSDRGIVIALSAAMQESSLRNIDYGDRDSLGLFQQRPSAGWGTPGQLLDPVYATKLFFGGPSNPNRGRTRGLLDIPGWQSMTVAQAAQRVQVSAFPDAYAKWEKSAWYWLDQLG